MRESTKMPFLSEKDVHAHPQSWSLRHSISEKRSGANSGGRQSAPAIVGRLNKVTSPLWRAMKRIWRPQWSLFECHTNISPETDAHEKINTIPFHHLCIRLTMVSIYNTVVDAKSWSSDIPASIQTARDYLSMLIQGVFTSSSGPVNLVLILLTLIVFWSDSVSLRYYFAASLACYAAILILTLAYFIPRDLILFTWSIPDHLEQIRTASAQWSVMNWLRSLLDWPCSFFIQIRPPRAAHSEEHERRGKSPRRKADASRQLIVEAARAPFFSQWHPRRDDG